MVSKFSLHSKRILNQSFIQKTYEEKQLGLSSEIHYIKNNLELEIEKKEEKILDEKIISWFIKNFIKIDVRNLNININIINTDIEKFVTDKKEIVVYWMK